MVQTEEFIDNLSLILISLGLLILSFVVSFSIHKREVKKIIQKRKSNKSAPVRTTDQIVLTKSQLATRDQAILMIGEGKILEGTKIFEELNLHRYAVSTLEAAGYIEEACAILIRLDKPLRAAALYSRNQYHKKAADIYIQVGALEEAARESMEAGHSDRFYFEKSGDLYVKLSDYELAKIAYNKGSFWEKLIDLAMESKDWSCILEVYDKFPKIFSKLMTFEKDKLTEFSSFLEKNKEEKAQELYRIIVDDHPNPTHLDLLGGGGSLT